MRYLFILLFPLLLAAACSDDDQLSPVDQLPPATQTGENIVACLIDGEPWVNDPNRTGEVNISAQYNDITNKLLIRSSKMNFPESGQNSSIEIVIDNFDTVNPDSISFQLVYLIREGLSEEVYCRVDRNFVLEITNIDYTNSIVSGIFAGPTVLSTAQEITKLENGHFDVTYY